MMTAPPDSARRQAYWRANRRLTLGLLLVWFLVTYLASFYADSLNRIVVFGFPLGFYMAAQGSLLIYVAIIGVYALAMRRLERRYGFEER